MTKKNETDPRPARKRALRGAVRELKLSDEELEVLLRRRGRSDWCEARKSGIHERGLFATQAIPKGTQVIEYVGPIVSKAQAQRRATSQERRAKARGEGAVYIFDLNRKHDVDGNVTYNTARLANHSCDPACETEISKGRIHLVALRNIKRGEEITYDYNFDLDSWEEHPCRCGARDCVGYIVGETHWPALKKAIRTRKKEKRS